jgi:hypothetical protein
LFEHDDIEVHDMENVPLERDIFMMDVVWMDGYEAALLKGMAGGDWDNIGYVSYVCARTVSNESLELSWYPNIYDRHHEVRVTLPRSEFVTCTEMPMYDEKPRIFVTSEWLEDLHLKKALANGTLTREKLVALRGRIDEIASRYPNVSFTSFADSLLLKSNWTVGQWDRPVTYTYEPEKIIEILPELSEAYSATLGLPIYAVVTQGRNEFYEAELMHISPSKNHVSLNSLGLPFAQLMSIEATAKSASRNGEHLLSELYMDENFFRSLKLRYEFDKNSVRKFPYLAPMATSPCQYVLGTFEMVLSNLRID